MKLVTLISLLLISCSSFAGLKSETDIKFAGDAKYFGFCEAIIKNDLSLLKRNVTRKIGDVASSRKMVLRKLLSKDGVSCNGTDLISFSKQREATEVHAYLTEFAE